MNPHALQQQLSSDLTKSLLPVAIVATTGTTNAGAIDPLKAIGRIAQENNMWFHVDGAYGLPGILDPQVHRLFDGLEMADSVVVDPHKWLGAPVGTGATFVRDINLLQRAFTQEEADYLEGSCNYENIQNSMDSLGFPYSDLGVELSAPSRGAVVWALIREIGKSGLRARICRHNAMARRVSKMAREHPDLEVIMEPVLSICCFRFTGENLPHQWDLNDLNRQIHQQLIQNGKNIPSTTTIDGVLVIRPCFIGARTEQKHAEALVNEVIRIGNDLIHPAASQQISNWK